MQEKLRTYLDTHVKAAPLAVFRILFGVMMFFSVIRFWSYGWIEKFYIQPRFFFSYQGFEFVQPLGIWTYGLFIICGLSALGVALGYRYRLSIITFFLSFTYIELMDKTTYLNHYYFISILSFVMIFLPAASYFSLDAKRNPYQAFEYVPRWSIDAIKALLCIVYFYAGLAKLNSEWLIHAMPLKIWLPTSYDLPMIGSFLQETWAIYIFSWAGAIYDLSIPFFLMAKKTRNYAFMAVIVFHVLTGMLFPIGMFPYIMMAGATIFLGLEFHNNILMWISRLIRTSKAYFDNGKALAISTNIQFARLSVLTLFFVFQLIFPFRHLASPGELFWTEDGYRFSWRVMLMEKAGYANFKIVDKEAGTSFYVDNSDFLTPFQEKQMSTQPDFILEYAHFLKDHFENQGHRKVEVYVESYVALNGRRSRPYVNPEINLTAVKQSTDRTNWLLPFNDSIKGI